LTRVALRITVLTVMLAIALTGAEFAARYVFRSALAPHPRISRNRLGFRERQVAPKAADVYRIAVIGDSFTFGDGIEERDRFSNRLQTLLGPRYEVLNFGTRAHNMPEHLQKLERVLKLDPDFVLLQLYENDFETREMTRPDSYPLLSDRVDRRMARVSVLFRLTRDAWVKVQQKVGIAEEYSHYMARHLSDPNSPDAQTAFGSLRQFIVRSRAAGVPTGAVLFPALWAMGSNPRDYPFRYLHEHVKATCAAEQAPFLDLYGAFAAMGDARALWVNAFDAHPNAKANERAAAEIFSAFGPLWRP
jgi:hypothetical protein